MSKVEMDYREFDDLQEKMAAYGSESLREINDILHGDGAKTISDKIHILLPSSGRKWKGKKTAARATQPFKQENEQLAVTIRTKPNYHYLYFPDDGSNTLRHAGNQQFMVRGAENSKNKIIELCIGRLTEKLSGG